MSFLTRPPRLTSLARDRGRSAVEGESSEGQFSVELLTEEQQLRLRREFHRFDRDRSGFISAGEMLQVAARQ